MHTGSFDVAPILFIDYDPLDEYEIIHLYFSDGTEVKVIYEHAFWDFNLNRYIFMRPDAAKYIGHWYKKKFTDINGELAWKKVQLVDVQIYYKTTRAWSPVTFSHFSFYANGMLSLPGSTESLINIFNVIPETIKICRESYLADITKYGLFCYETDFAHLVPVEIFHAFNGQYLKIAMAKGILTEEHLMELIIRYSSFWE